MKGESRNRRLRLVGQAIPPHFFSGLRAGAVTAVAAVLLAAFAAAAAERELTGRVVDANTGEPVARAHVTVRFLQVGQSAPEVTLLSDADGTFKVTNVPDGQYQVMCEKAGYLPLSQIMAGMPPSATPGTATVLKLTAQAAIQGRVVDERDMPANATVQLVSQQIVNGRRQWQTAQGTGTDETGFFRLFGLPAGRYYVSVTARLHGALASKPLAYPPFYYPGATDIAAGQPLDLKAGDEAEIKIKLPPPVPAFTVSGLVDTASTNIGLSLARQPAAQGFQRSSGELELDQRTKAFRFTHVTPGMYSLMVSVWQNPGNPLSANVPVAVGNADVTGIRLEPAPTGIDGTVHMEDPSQRPSGFISVQSDRGTNGSPIDAEGKFHIQGIQPGTYRIVPQINGAQTCVQSILSGGRDVRDGFTFASAPPDPLDISLSSHCGSVEVSLPPSDASWPGNLAAYLLRRSGDELILEKIGYQAPNARDGSRHFLIAGVAPGDYTVYIWPNDAPIEYTNADYMRQFDSYGQKVTVSADSPASVTVDKPVLPAAKN